MPLYDYHCATCDRRAEEFRSVSNRNDAPTCKCGQLMRKVLSVSKPIGDVEPYYDDNLEAGVKSKQHRRELMRERGVYEKFGKGWH